MCSQLGVNDMIKNFNGHLLFHVVGYAAGYLISLTKFEF